MLAISTTFLQLMGVCLALKTCAARLASVTPKSRGGLEHRIRILCDTPDLWMSRECLPADSLGVDWMNAKILSRKWVIVQKTSYA